MFVLSATIEKEMRKQFNISDGKEVRLWNKCTNNAYEQLSKLDSTIQDAGLYQGQVRNQDIFLFLGLLKQVAISRVINFYKIF